MFGFDQVGTGALASRISPKTQFVSGNFLGGIILVAILLTRTRLT